MHFGWVPFNIEISKVTGPNFTGLVSPNAEGIAVDGIKIRFWISSSVSEIFAAKLRSRPKSGQILHVFGPWNFLGVCPPKFWTGIIKFGLVVTIVQNFTPVGPRISEISHWQKNKKTSGLKHKSAPQAIAFGRTNNNKEPELNRNPVAWVLESSQKFSLLINYRKCNNWLYTATDQWWAKWIHHVIHSFGINLLAQYNYNIRLLFILQEDLSYIWILCMFFIYWCIMDVLK